MRTLGEETASFLDVGGSDLISFGGALGSALDFSERIVVFIALIFVAGFLIGAVRNTIGPQPSLAGAVVGYALAIFLFDIWRTMRRDSALQESFERWLYEHRDPIKKGGAQYGGTLITEETELKHFYAALSLLFVSFKIPSRSYLIGREFSGLTGLKFSLCSVMVGWWGFFWGPIYTISSLLANLQGGERRRVGDLLDELTGHEKRVVEITERAAENAVRIMTERGFPPNTAVRLESEGPAEDPTYLIQYDDQPFSQGLDWTWHSHGVTLLVNKTLARRVEGMTIDFQGGDYAFKLSPKASKGSDRLRDRELDA